MLCLLLVSASADTGTETRLENSAITWTIYTNVSESRVDNGTYAWDGLVQLRIPQEQFAAGNGVAGGGKPEWTLTQTGGTVTYAFDYEMEEWNDYQGIMLKKKGDWPATGNAVYQATCKWNGKTYEGTVTVLFRTIDKVPSGINMTVALYDPSTGTAGTAISVSGSALELTEGETYLVSTAYKDNEPACEYGHWLNTGPNEQIGLVDPRPETSTQLIIRAGKVGECTMSFDLTPGQTNLQINGQYKILVGCKTHTEETLAGKAATCTAEGLTDGLKCSVCGKVFKAQEVIPMLPHTEVVDAARDATCYQTGLTEGKHCSVCNQVLVKQTEIDKVPHTVVVDDAVAATCMLSGLTEGSHCSVCGEVLKAQEMVPLLDHDFDDGVVTKEATFTENGIRTYTCKRCGGTMEETISIRIRIDKSGWVQNSDGTWFYGDADGNALVGPQSIGGVLYCFNEKGNMITGWELVDGKWYYAEPSGALYNTGWVLVNGTWYYFKASGEMAVGWISDGGVYYYMKPDGTMATGWVEDNGDWYFMADSGAMMTGWMKSGTDWYLLKSSGKMATGWQNEGGFWYYFKPSGVMADGWNEIGGSWYYFKNGAMVTGWFEDKEAEQRLPANQKKALWYWFDSNGAMAKGWQMVNGQWEMFDEHSGLWLYTWQGN